MLNKALKLYFLLPIITCVFSLYTFGGYENGQETSTGTKRSSITQKVTVEGIKKRIEDIVAISWKKPTLLALNRYPYHVSLITTQISQLGNTNDPDFPYFTLAFAEHILQSPHADPRYNIAPLTIAPDLVKAITTLHITLMLKNISAKLETAAETLTHEERTAFYRQMKKHLLRINAFYHHYYQQLPNLLAEHGQPVIDTLHRQNRMLININRKISSIPDPVNILFVPAIQQKLMTIQQQVTTIGQGLTTLLPLAPDQPLSLYGRRLPLIQR